MKFLKNASRDKVGILSGATNFSRTIGMVLGVIFAMFSDRSYKVKRKIKKMTAA